MKVSELMSQHPFFHFVCFSDSILCTQSRPVIFFFYLRFKWFLLLLFLNSQSNRAYTNSVCFNNLTYCRIGLYCLDRVTDVNRKRIKCMIPKGSTHRLLCGCERERSFVRFYDWCFQHKMMTQLFRIHSELSGAVSQTSSVTISLVLEECCIADHSFCTETYVMGSRHR